MPTFDTDYRKNMIKVPRRSKSMNTDKKAPGTRAGAGLKPKSPKQKSFGKLKQKAMKSASGMR